MLVTQIINIYNRECVLINMQISLNNYHLNRKEIGNISILLSVNNRTNFLWLNIDNCL